MRTMVIGGSAAPPAMIDGFKKRHGLAVTHAWGMTEMSPLGTLARLKRRHAARGRRGRSSACARRRATPCRSSRSAHTGDDGAVLPWDGATHGRARGARARGSPRRTTTATSRGPLHRRWLVQDGRHRHDRPRGLYHDHRPLERRHQVRRRMDQHGRARKRADGAPGGARSGGLRRAPSQSGTSGRSRRSCSRRGNRPPAKSCALHLEGRTSPSSGCPTTTSSSRRSRKTSTGKFQKMKLREQYGDYLVKHGATA